MSQQLQALISVPEGYVIIESDKVTDLLDESLIGRTWSMSDLEERTGRGVSWLKEHLLYPYREVLDINNGGFVRYPETQGQRWKFGALKMSRWLEDNLEKVL